MSNFLKVTYYDGDINFHTYIQNASGLFSELKTQLVFSVFLQRKLPETEMRIFWIDDDKDQIDILDQQDYEIFDLKIRINKHIYVEPQGNTGKNKDGKQAEAGKAIHNKVECDGCNLNPIVGNRFKCLQCKNFDLCGKCEAKGLHGDHMMLRIPTPLRMPMDSEFFWSCPGLGGGINKRNKRNSGACLFEEDVNAAGTSTEGKGYGRHHRKHSRISRSSGIFANLCDMMQHLAEGGVDGTYNNTDQQHTDDSSQGEKESEGKAPPKTPPPTPTNTNPTQTKKEATTNTSPNFSSEQLPKSNIQGGIFIPPTPPRPPTPPTPPHLNSPLLENVQNFVDPQYMRAGIQILTNFSEMFSKILDPMDGNSTDGCPFNAGGINIGPLGGQSFSFSATTENGNKPNGPFPMPNAGPFPMPNGGPFPMPNGGPFPMPNVGPFPMPNAVPTGGQSFSFSASTENGNKPNGPFPMPNAGPFPMPNAGPFPMPGPTGPFPMPGPTGGQSFSFSASTENGNKPNGPIPMPNAGPQTGVPSFTFLSSTENLKKPNGEVPTPEELNLAAMVARRAAHIATHKAAIAVTKAAAANFERNSGKKANVTPTATASATEGTSSASTEMNTQFGNQANNANKSESKGEHVEGNNRKNSQSEENDWQMVDKTSDTPNANNSEHVSMASIASNNSAGIGDHVDFVKLSKDLQAHVEKEQGMNKSTETPIITTPPVVTPAPEPSPTPAAAPAPALGNNDERRAIPVYHADVRINNAVIAMMSMGFSNEGGWLTQLLESVHGNIPEALDTMSAAQQNKK